MKKNEKSEMTALRFSGPSAVEDEEEEEAPPRALPAAAEVVVA